MVLEVSPFLELRRSLGSSNLLLGLESTLEPGTTEKLPETLWVNFLGRTEDWGSSTLYYLPTPNSEI